MLWGETTRLAAQALWAHKLRSLLTVLGIIVAVSSLIAVVSFVGGLNAYVAEKIFNLGADVFIASKADLVITDMDTWLEAQKRRDLVMDDFRAQVGALPELQVRLPPGLAAGLADTFGLTRFLESFLFGVTYHRPGDLPMA